MARRSFNVGGSPLRFPSEPVSIMLPTMIDDVADRKSPHVHSRAVDGDLLVEIIRRIVQVSAPIKVVLFGSRARDSHRPDSDIDLLVVKESNEPRWQRAVPIYRALAGIGAAVDTDIIVYTPQEVEEWRHASAAFVTTALREGKVVYEG
jgi:predicted nucleotidyltransferase